MTQYEEIIEMFPSYRFSLNVFNDEIGRVKRELMINGEHSGITIPSCMLEKCLVYHCNFLHIIKQVENYIYAIENRKCHKCIHLYDSRKYGLMPRWRCYRFDMGEPCSPNYGF